MRRSSRRMRPLVLLAALPALAGPLALASAAAPDDPDRDDAAARAARGRTSYRIYCTNCHGANARGEGPIAELLKVPPSDLTVLARNAGGRFPADDVYKTIDGRLDVRGHGSREMPIWGLSFQESGRDSDQETEVRERILDLVAYLESIQVGRAD